MLIDFADFVWTTPNYIKLGCFHDNNIKYLNIGGLTYLPSIENSNITNRSRNKNSHIGGSD